MTYKPNDSHLKEETIMPPATNWQNEFVSKGQSVNQHYYTHTL